MDDARTARINGLRGLLSEFGIIVGAGACRGVDDAERVVHEADNAVPHRLRAVLAQVVAEIRDLEEHIDEIDSALRSIANEDPVTVRLMGIPGVGVVTATALIGSVAHVHGFRRRRQFASWLRLTPREHSSGARRVLGGITKRGNVDLRYLLTHGGTLGVVIGTPSDDSQTTTQSAPAMGARRG